MAKSLEVLESLNIPGHVKDAARVFSSREIETLGAFFDDESGSFLGLGFINEAGKFAQYANPLQAQAISVLETYYREEMANGSARWGSG